MKQNTQTKMIKRMAISVILIIFSALCLFAIMMVYKAYSPKSALEIATETEENYKLDDEQRADVRNANDFSVNLFKKISEKEDRSNVFVSTIGLLYSMNVINNGASGQTQQEICKALHMAPTDVERINKLCRRFMIGQAKTIETEDLGPLSHMRTAMIFHVGEGVAINKSFQKVLEQDYFAGVIKGKVNSSLQHKINRWCAEQTGGLLPGVQINETDDRSATLLVANYFNGSWVMMFDHSSTKTEPFYGGTSSKVYMMNKTEDERVFSYAKLDDFSMLSLPYNGGYRLYVILPDKVDGLTALMQSLDGEKIRSAMRKLKSYDCIYVKIPKFEVAYTFTANAFLESLGIRKVFSDSSELTRIQSMPMKIKEIKQETKVIMDEEGTRAGAMTSCSFCTLSSLMNPTEAYFYADHPFCYIISDPFGNFCFMGTFRGDPL